VDPERLDDRREGLGHPVEDSATYDLSVTELVEPRRDEPRIPLAIRPFMWLALVLVAWLAIDAVGTIGPLDRARLGWAIGMPLTLLLPAVTGAVARGIPSGRLRIAVFGGVGVICGLVVVVPFMAQLVAQCASVGAALPIASLATLGIGVALTVIASSVVAERLWRTSDGRRRVAWTVTASAVILLIGGAILVAVTYSSLFPPGTCAVRP
jgi:hypothetical protein